MKRIILFLILCFALPIVYAYLGEYKTGETVYFSAQFNNGSGIAKSATNVNYTIFNTSFDLKAGAGMTAVSGYDGMYKSNYAVPSSADKGIWTIRINGTIDGASPATVINFKVVDNITQDVYDDLNSGVALTAATETQIDNIETDTAAMDTAAEWDTLMATALTGIEKNRSSLSSQLNTNTSTVISRGNTAWITATGFSTLAQAVSILLGIGTNRTHIESQLTSNLSNIQAYGDSEWATADVSALATTAQLQQNTSAVINNITSGVGNIISRGNTAWITATGFQTETDANTRYDNIIAYFNALANITESDVWASASRILTSFTFNVNLTTEAVDDIDLRLNNSHSTGNWSATSASACDATAANQALILAGIQDNSTHLEGNISTLRSELTTVQTDLDDTSQYKADVSGLCTLENASDIINNQSNIKGVIDDILVDTNDIETDLNDGVSLTSATETQIDNIEDDTDEIQGNQSNFVTATGFSTSVQADSILLGIQDNRTSIENKINTLANATITDIDNAISDEAILIGMENNRSSIENNLSTIRGEIATAQTDLDNPNQYKADVSALATTSQLAQNTSAIMSNVSNGVGDVISIGNTNWITSSGFASLINMTTIVSLINSLNNLADSEVWTYTARTLTDFGGVWNETPRDITGGNLTTPNDYKADVSALATTANVDSHFNSLANITTTDVDNVISDEDILTGIESNKTYLEGNLSTIRDDIASLNDVSTTDLDNACISELEVNTSHGVGLYNTTADVSSLATASQLTSNISNLQAYGDSNWITATGFATTAQALALLAGIQSNTSYLEGNLSTLPSVVWNVGSRTVTSVAWTIYTGWSTLQNFVWNTTERTVINDTITVTNKIDTLANLSESDLDTYCIDEAELNLSHSSGNYSAVTTSVTATITSSDKTDIANQTFRMTIQNKTENYYNNSLGYPTYETNTYASGEEVNRSYGYYSDNITIKNSTNTRK